MDVPHPAKTEWPLPVHRAIAAIDIEASTARTNVAKARLRDVMYQVLEGALEATGITDARRDPLINSGDGAVVLVHPVDQAPKTLLLNTFVPTLKELLIEQAAQEGDQLRLRAAVHAGEVHSDQRGWFGEALDVTFRLLDAPEVKAALRQTRDPLVLVVSDYIYRTVIRHGYDGIDEDAYAPLVDVTVAGHHQRGWVHLAPTLIKGRRSTNVRNGSWSRP